MAHFKEERNVLKRQVERRIGEILPFAFRFRRPIDGWETACAGTGCEIGPPPADGWHPWDRTLWGGADVTQWFRARAVVPREMSDWPVVAILAPGGEALCHVNGVMRQGLDANRSVVRLTDRAGEGETFAFVIDAWAGMRPGQEYVHRFAAADLAAFDEPVWSFAWDLRVAMDVVRTLPDDSTLGIRLLDLLERTLRRIDIDRLADPEDACAIVRDAQVEFRRKARDFQHSHNDGAFTITGQSHIDTAWLWPIRVTRKKVGRTFATALRYMEQYPEFTFVMSQAQLYEYAKENYPEIYAQVKRRIAEGRWEVAGAAWVEQDLNVPSGEAHVRQYLFGNRFFRKEFGIHTRSVWLPDCFGYAFSLPQIMRKAGIEYFYTTKLHGNEYNRHPYNLFRWRGIDGSEVLALQTPYGCNDNPVPQRLLFSWETFRQKDVADAIPFTFGHGDGGGGPTVEQIEYVRRLENVTGFPRSTWGSAIATFDHLRDTLDPDRVPVFHDEMFYERHRGCQTSQARTKRNNRKSELLARDTEFAATLAMLGGAPYPQDEIAGAWKLILLNQFHDILPGSSIGEVYVDADRDYARVRETLTAVRDATLIRLDLAVDTRGEGTPIVVRNTLGWERADVASLARSGSITTEMTVIGPDGAPVASQVSTEPDGSSILLFETAVPAMGHAVYRLVEGARPSRLRGPKPPKVSASRLENDFLRVRFAKDGTIARIFDKTNGREVLAAGSKGNELQAFDDRPDNNDAWDINFNYVDSCRPFGVSAEIAVVESGPVRATVEITTRSARSTVRQRLSLWRTLPRIDFATVVDWDEKHTLLKAAFPVDVHSRTATYEIQYGAIERPTHWSTSWDRARFEVPAHRWIDLSESGYGVSLLNDCKYGFDVHDNVMRISLLRSPTSPDPHCDEGRHEFAYSLFPHAGNWDAAETVRRGYEFNAPLLARAASSHAGEMPAASGFCAVDRANVVVDCVKKAEDSGAVIVRLYEAHGARGPVSLTFAQAPRSVTECDLMEENDTPVDLAGPTVRFDIKPWEIRTFKVVF